MSEPTDDFLDNLARRDAADEARKTAIAPAQRPRTGPKAKATGRNAPYALAALKKACEAIVSSPTRNVTTNDELFNLGQLVAAKELDRATVETEIRAACKTAGLPASEIKLLLRADGGLDAGIKSGPRDMTAKAPVRIPATAAKGVRGVTVDPPPDEGERKIVLTPMGSVKTSVPMWIWEWEGVGRLQLGTLALFAGKPAAGKSTATRWFAAQMSNGTLPGIWEGNPMKVAIYSPEEQLENTIAPSLLAVGADMNNIVAIAAEDGGEESGILSVRDERRLIDTLVDNNIRALFVDPIMQTFDGVDTNKTSEVRQHLLPYVRIAKAINGIAIGVTHLRKGSIADVMTSINGSSAFGEVPRSIFGFAPVGDGTNVMEQVKNSAGATGLKLEYRLPIERGLADDGQYYELPRFEIKGETELSVIDLGGERNDEDATTSSADVVWLQRYLSVEQPAPSKRVKDDALKSADISNSRLHKARKKLKVRIVSTPQPDAPHTTAWCLPEYQW